MLDQRKKDVLKAIVEDYIETAEPVASKTLVEKYQLPVSSATIRNTMSELELMGYLDKPHTSAGRIPSDLGYREYVEHLMSPKHIDKDYQLEITNTLNVHMDEMDNLLRSASWILSEGTGYTSLAVSPRLASSSVRQLKMLMIEPGKVLIVLVLSAGLVKDKIVRLPDILGPQELNHLAASIENRLDGLELKDITLVTVQTSLRDNPLPEGMLNQVAYEAYSAIKQADHLETFVDGVPNMFQHPEFKNVDQGAALLNLLRDQGMIVGLLENTETTTVQIDDSGHSNSKLIQGDSPVFMIRIGQEIQQAEFNNCSFVAATCRLPGQISGAIGVIGPKRMEYSRVISHIGFVRQTIQRLNDEQT